MSITTNSSSYFVALTRTLNNLNLEAVDAVKLRNAQEETVREQRARGDIAAEKLGDQLHQQNALAIYHAQSDAAQAKALQALVPPKAQLSPADEVKTFANTSGTQSKSPISSDAQSAQALSTPPQAQGHAVAEDGSSVAVNIITPQSTPDAASAQVLNIATRAQAATAALYANNSQAVYQSASIAQLAA